MREVRLQPLVRARVRAQGEGAARWAAGLPDLLTELEQQWDVTLGRGLPGGSSSYVARATTADGGAAVVKLVLPGQPLAAEADVLSRADGRGYARLIAVDLDRRALLLEALGPSLDRSGLPPQEQLLTLARTLRLAWQVPAAEGDAPRALAADLALFVVRTWAALDRPCPQAVVTQALVCAERRADVDPADLVLAHGDPHPGNLLAVPAPRPGAETGHCLIDPEGLLAERAYDLGVALRDWSLRLVEGTAVPTLRGYCALLAAETGVDAQRIWEWGYLERVSTGLLLTSLGASTVGASFLRSAALLLDTSGRLAPAVSTPTTSAAPTTSSACRMPS